MSGPRDPSCPACHEPVLAADAFCESCGARLPANPSAAGPTTEPAAGPQPRPVPAPTRACPCGAGSADSDGYCDNCGRLVPDGRDHFESDLGPRGALVSDRGVRHRRNEDAGALVTGTDGGVIAVVADGVSTSQDPQAASAAASSALARALAAAVGAATDDLLRGAVQAASAAVAAATDPGLVDPDGRPRPEVSVPACTLAAAQLSGPQLTVLNVGDSRVYWLPPEGEPELLSVEDSWAADAIAAGAPAATAYADPRAHVITAWIGVDSGPVEPHIVRRSAAEPGTVIVCSDGLWNYLSDPTEFAAVVRRHLAAAAGSPLAAARSLTDFARDAGGHDNITVAVVPVPSP
jgi:PPM family protein phosphatase